MQRRLALWTFQTATVMAVLDSSIANVALPTISHELHASPTQSIWIVNAFQIVITATIFAFASLGELIGFEYVYRTGLTLFTFGSLLCALSHSLPQLIASRMLQGLGAAMIMGIQPGMIRRIYPPNMLGRGTGWMALTVATSAAAGPTVGGAILAIAHWSWLFMINVPIGTLDLIASFKTMPKFPTDGNLARIRSRRRSLDRARAQLLHARCRGRRASWNRIRDCGMLCDLHRLACALHSTRAARDASARLARALPASGVLAFICDVGLLVYGAKASPSYRCPSSFRPFWDARRLKPVCSSRRGRLPSASSRRLRAGSPIAIRSGSLQRSDSE